MANKNTLKVRMRRERRKHEISLKDIKAFMENRTAFMIFTCSLYSNCNNSYCRGLSLLEMYNVKRAIRTYTDCQLLANCDTDSSWIVFNPESKDYRVGSDNPIVVRMMEDNFFRADAWNYLRSWCNGQLAALIKESKVSPESAKWILSHVTFAFQKLTPES